MYLLFCLHLLIIDSPVYLMCSGVTMEDGENWSSQINRLQELLDKLECQVWCFVLFFFKQTYCWNR